MPNDKELDDERIDCDCHDDKLKRVQIFGASRWIPVQTDTIGRLDMVATTPLNTRELDCFTDSVLACGLGVDGVMRTIQQDIHGTTSTLPNSSAYCQAGRLFSVVFAIRTSGATTEHIAFENASGNTRTMYLENVSIGVSIDDATVPRDYEETLTVDISRAASITPGLTLTPVNRNLGSAADSTLLVSNIDTFGALSSLAVTKHPTGECSLSFQGQIIVPPGNILLVSASDNLAPGRTGTLAITVTWLEL